MAVRVQREDFDVGVESERLTAGNTSVGGLCVFVGLVRDMAGDTGVAVMTLEHYPGMTEKMLEEIETEARRRWPLDASLIIHRYGRLEPGDRIVLVACASPHRQAAFEASQFLMDWLKTKAPFWKVEESKAGDEACILHWSSTFQPVGVPDEEMIAQIRDSYMGGVESLRARLGG